MASSSRHRPPSSSRNRTLLIVGGLVVAIVVAAIIAVVATGSDDTAEGLEQVQPITVEGDALPPLVDDEDDLARGMIAPTLDGLTYDGTAITVEHGEPTLLVFLAHWCSHCQAEVPRIVDWADSGAVPEDLRVVGVTTSTDGSAPNYPPSKWLDGEDWPFEVMADDADGSAAAAYGLPGFPYMVFLDDEGQVVWRTSGELEEGELEALVNGSMEFIQA